jgi:hypothetical protein
MRRHAVALATGFLAIAGNVHATMPMLTDEPKPALPKTCKEWATKQGVEALEMWGIQEDGKSSRTVGINRLASYCMGQPKPEIVGFGSSAGFDRAYCNKHQEQDLCGARQKPESPTRDRLQTIQGCFIRNYDKDHLARHPDQTVTSVKFKIYPSPSDVNTNWFAIRMQRRGEYKALHNQGYCKQEKSETKCFVECDGGGVRLVTRSNSAIVMRLGIQSPSGPNGESIKQDERIRMSACGAEDVDDGSGLEVTGGKDDHEFLLSHVDDGKCVGIDH